jgi:hypothetical protein
VGSNPTPSATLEQSWALIALTPIGLEVESPSSRGGMPAAPAGMERVDLQLLLELRTELPGCDLAVADRRRLSAASQY